MKKELTVKVEIQTYKKKYCSRCCPFLDVEYGCCHLFGVSLDFKKRKALLVSLPRDIWSPTLRDKINSAFHYGEEKKKGGGLTLAKFVVEEVLGQPVHYSILVDFSSFKGLIDL